MKHAIEISYLIAAIYFLSGCTVLDKIGGAAFEAEVSTEMIDGVPTNVTNWVTKPNIKAGITLGGQVAPQPIGGFISSVLLGALSIFGLWRSRNYKKAAVDAVEFGQAVKEELGKSELKDQLSFIKKTQKAMQKANGTWGVIRSILDKS